MSGSASRKKSPAPPPPLDGDLTGPMEILEAILRSKDGTPSQYMTSLFEDDDGEGVTDFTKEELSADPGKRLLHFAELGHLEEVREVLARDPDTVKVRDRDGYSPLHRAAYNNHVDVCQELLDADSSLVEARTAEEWTPLHSAARWDNLETARLLLTRGADPNARSHGHLTPLHLAASHREEVRCLELLLSLKEVDRSAINDQGDTALDIGRRTGPRHEALFDSIRPVLSVKELRDAEVAPEDDRAEGSLEAKIAKLSTKQVLPTEESNGCGAAKAPDAAKES